MKILATFLLAVFAMGSLPLAAFDEYYEVEGVRIKKDVVKIQTKGEIKKEKTDKKPAFREDMFTFTTKRAELAVRYIRFLNSPKNFAGKHQSLTSTDMGLGIPADANTWYGYNTIRVLLNGKDIFASIEASEIKWKEGPGLGRLGFLWNAPEANVFLNLAAGAGVRPVYCEVKIEPRQKITSFAIILVCYPGAYTAFYKLPFHRWVKTRSAEAEVSEKLPENKVIDLRASDGWAFYADKYHDARIRPSSGPCGLVVVPEEKISGKITVTNYPIITRLEVPPASNKVHFALYSFKGIANKVALYKLKRLYLKDRRILDEIKFWE